MQPWASKLLGDIRTLPESEAEQLIIEALKARPSLAQPVVAAVCPELTYAPSKALTDRRVVGRIKSFNHSTGYGFISCPELFQVFSSDVFLHKAQMGKFAVHQEVNFSVFLNQYNKPQAYDLTPIHGHNAHSDSLEGSASEATAAAATAAAALAAAPAQPPPPPGTPPHWRWTLPAPPPPPAPAAEPGERPRMALPAQARGTSCTSTAPVPARAWGSSLPSSGDLWKQDVPFGSTFGDRGPRYTGRIKSFNRRNGFGFIACPELHDRFGRDVYLHHSHLSGFSVGEEVCFTLLLNAHGHPQAKDLGACYRSTPGRGSADTEARVPRALQERELAAGAGARLALEEKRSAEEVRGLKELAENQARRLERVEEERRAAQVEVRRGLQELEERRVDEEQRTALAEAAVEARRAKAEEDADALFEGATCVICREVLHRATSVQPCLHCFCSSCLGRWVWTASTGPPQCPVCRERIAGVCRNTTVEGLIDGLLRAHPERARSAEELEAIDSRDVLRPALRKRLEAGVFMFPWETYEEFRQRLDSRTRFPTQDDAELSEEEDLDDAALLLATRQREWLIMMGETRLDGPETNATPWDILEAPRLGSSESSAFAWEEITTEGDSDPDHWAMHDNLPGLDARPLEPPAQHDGPQGGLPALNGASAPQLDAAVLQPPPLAPFCGLAMFSPAV